MRNGAENYAMACVYSQRTAQRDFRVTIRYFVDILAAVATQCYDNQTPALRVMLTDWCTYNASHRRQ
jgi:hypothetical protein